MKTHIDNTFLFAWLPKLSDTDKNYILPIARTMIDKQSNSNGRIEVRLNNSDIGVTFHFYEDDNSWAITSYFSENGCGYGGSCMACGLVFSFFRDYQKEQIQSLQYSLF